MSCLGAITRIAIEALLVLPEVTTYTANRGIFMYRSLSPIHLGLEIIYEVLSSHFYIVFARWRHEIGKLDYFIHCIMHLLMKLSLNYTLESIGAND